MPLEAVHNIHLKTTEHEDRCGGPQVGVVVVQINQFAPWPFVAPPQSCGPSKEK